MVYVVLFIVRTWLIVQIPEFNNFYLDMNGIIHTCSHPNDDDPTFRISEEEIFSEIFRYLKVLYCTYNCCFTNVNSRSFHIENYSSNDYMRKTVTFVSFFVEA